MFSNSKIIKITSLQNEPIKIYLFDESLIISVVNGTLIIENI